MKKWVWLSLVLILGISLWDFYYFLWAPFGRGGIFYVEKGMGVSQIAAQLESQGFIRSELAFKLWAKFAKPKNLHFGEYEIPPMTRIKDILTQMEIGQTRHFSFTIPEGLTFREIGDRVKKAGLLGSEKWSELFADGQLRAKLGFEVVNLEGYLFPSTYQYDGHTTAPQLLEQMIEGFNREFNQSLRTQSQALGMSIPQVMALASIIEKATGAAVERPMIGGVFHNRLKKGMRLETDPTVIYGIQNFDGNLTRAHLLDPHPYNTYIHPGLPPGPIANPGLASIKAALYPAQHEYLFFVSKGDGTHYFSKTYDEHLAAVQKYQLGQK